MDYITGLEFSSCISPGGIRSRLHSKLAPSYRDEEKKQNENIRKALGTLNLVYGCVCTKVYGMDTDGLQIHS